MCKNVDCSWFKKATFYTDYSELQKKSKTLLNSINFFWLIYLLNLSFFYCKDSQEFLRCLMDQLHEELKEPITEPYEHSSTVTTDGNPEEDNHSQSDDFQSCESCDSSARADSEVFIGNMLLGDTNEAEMLIPEQDEIQDNREWQKEKNIINDLYRSSLQSGMGGSIGMNVDKDIDTTTEITPIIGCQGATKVQGRTSGTF